MTDATATYLPPPPAPPRRGWVASLHIGQVIMLTAALALLVWASAFALDALPLRDPSYAESVGYGGTDPKIIRAIEGSRDMLLRARNQNERVQILLAQLVPPARAQSLVDQYGEGIDYVPLVRAGFMANGYGVDTTIASRIERRNSRVLLAWYAWCGLVVLVIFAVWWQWFGGRRREAVA